MDPNDWEVINYVRLDLNPKALSGTKEFAEQITRLHGKPGRVLEIGCAAGWILRAAEDLGWIGKGVEAAPKFSKFARGELGLDIFEGTIAEIEPSQWSRFDVIMAFDVFEHLQDPLRDLKILRELAGPQARLLLATPDIGSFIARAYRMNWSQIVPSHINYSTEKSMSALLARSGWVLERISEPRYWDPDRDTEKRNVRLEIVKFLARSVLVRTLLPLGKRSPFVRRLPSMLTSGKLTWSQVKYRIGGRPVLGDVMFVIARPM